MVFFQALIFCLFLLKYSDVHLSLFSPNAENAGKMQTRITPNTDTFYVVLALVNNLKSGVFITGHKDKKIQFLAPIILLK